MGVRSLRQVSLNAADVDRAVGFYRDVLDLPFVGSFGPIAFFEIDGVRLIIEPNPDRRDSSVLYFAVDDIDRERTRLERRGVVFEDDIHMIHRDEQGTFGAPAEEWMTFFRDSEGNLLALSSRVPLGPDR